MEYLKALALQLGATPDFISKLADPPEGFEPAVEVKKFAEGREAFYVEKHTPTIEKAYEERVKGERYAAIVKPLINKLAKDFDLSKTDLEGKDVKDVIALASAKQGEAVKAAATETDKELRESLEQYKSKYTQATGKIEELERVLPEKEEELKRTYAERDDAREIDKYLSTVVNSDRFKEAKKVGKLDKVLKLYAQDYGYKFAVDRTEEDKPRVKIVATDGTTALTLDGKHKLENPDDGLVAIARAEGLFPDHNGGRGETPDPNKRIVGDKEIAAAGENFLRGGFN